MEYNISISSSVASLANGAGMLVISAIFIIGFILFMRYQAKILPAVLGVILYMVATLMGLELITYLLMIIPGVMDVFLSSNVVFYVFRALILAILMIVAAYIGVSICNRSNTMSVGDALMTGLGLGAGQGIITLLDMLSIASFAGVINDNGFDKLIEGASNEDIDIFYQTATSIAEVDPAYYLVRGINCVVDIAFFVFMVVCIYAVIKGAPRVFKGCTVIFAVAVCTLTVFYDYAVIANFYILLAIKLLAVAFYIYMILTQVDSQYLNGQIKSFEKAKVTGSMPRFKLNKK